MSLTLADPANDTDKFLFTFCLGVLFSHSEKTAEISLLLETFKEKDGDEKNESVVSVMYPLVALLKSPNKLLQII